jgi:glycosyltransferase involved in cell wall biosynthesis
MNVLCVVPQNIKHETVQFLGLKNKGVNLYLVTGRRCEPDYSRLTEAGIPVEQIPIRKRIDRPAAARIRRLIRDNRIDIVHAFNNKTVSNALRASRGLPVRFIAYRGIVGNVSFVNPASWMTYLNPRVDRIICVADAIRDHLLDLRFLGMSIPPHKAVTVYKGHDPAWYSAAPADLGEFGIDKGGFTVACTANFRPRKGVDVLIRALDYMPEQSNIHVLLIGKMDHPRLRKKIARSRFRDRIHLTGHRDNAPQIQAACDICVLPSVRREGLPKSVIEGMAYGVPPVVTDSGGSPELVEAGVSGLVVSPGSASDLAGAIMKLHKDPALRARMGAAARRRIEEYFTVEQTVEKTYRVYRDLMN